MNTTGLSTTELVLIITLTVIMAVGITTWLFLRKSRVERLRTRFGNTGYVRTMKDGCGKQFTEAGGKNHIKATQGLHIQPLLQGDRKHFVESWHKVQMQFVDNPGGAVTDADQLLQNVMSTCGYPVSDFEQHAADILADHPLVFENYRKAHEIAVSQTRGRSSTEDLHRAMIYYQTLIEALIPEPKTVSKKAAS